jgi:DNA-binding CsgD family transcriptional regulator/PAS domain-containing protein
MAAATRRKRPASSDDVAVNLLYEVPLEEKPWQRFLDFLLERHRARAVNLELERPAPGNRGLDFSAAVWDAQTPHEHYTSQYYALNPFRYEEMKHGQTYLWSDFIERRRFLASEFYRSFCAPLGIEHTVCLCVESPVLGQRAWLQIARGARRGAFQKAEIAALQALTPHLERVLRLLARLGGLEYERTAYESTVDALAIGTIVLDQHGKVLSLNPQATAVVAANPVLRLRAGQFGLTDVEEDRRLQGLIQRELRRPDPGRMAAMSVARAGSGALGLLLRAYPRQTTRTSERHPALIVHVADPDVHQIAPEQLISQLFGLSASEARLAALLADGVTLEEAARRMSVSLGSARTYSKRIFAKTGVGRQAELVRLILKSVASLAQPTQAR